MKTRLILTAAILLPLIGCASSPKHHVMEVPKTPDPVDMKIASSAEQVQRHLRRLADTNNAVAIERLDAEKVAYINKQAVTVPDGMDKLLNLTWYGQIETGLSAAASFSGYKVVVQNKRPTPDIMIRVKAKDVPVIDVIRDIGLQAGSRATVRVVEQDKVVELKYADR